MNVTSGMIGFIVKDTSRNPADYTNAFRPSGISLMSRHSSDKKMVVASGTVKVQGWLDEVVRSLRDTIMASGLPHGLVSLALDVTNEEGWREGRRYLIDTENGHFRPVAYHEVYNAIAEYSA